MKYPNQIRKWRKERGLTLQKLRDRYADAAAAVGASPYSLQHLGRLETGERKLTMQSAHIIGAALEMNPQELFPEGFGQVPIVGIVGAGAEVFPFDDYPQGHGMDMTPCPQGLDPSTTVAVRVQGDSMGPLITEGALLYYSRDPEQDTAAVVGRTCIVKVLDGPTLVKKVLRAPTPGKFNLVSSNAGIIEDATLEWAAPVGNISMGDT